MAYLDAEDPVARAATEAIQQGDLRELRRLLAAHPGLATARLGAPGGTSWTLLHAATDWPGHYPDGPRTVAVLIESGAKVDARFAGPHRETPLHWAASTDDVPVLDVLLDAGAHIEADGAVIGGGTPLADACAFAQWNAARRLVERGATTSLWQEASLGLIDRVAARLTAPGGEDITEALWAAAHGGQLRTAQLLLEHDADPHWVGYDDLTPLGAALRSGATDVADWLRAQGATDPGPHSETPPHTH
ncbi:ankyrin repeat domain-containing protein [Actinomadura violacea]|uniref:Ankyrin repeat domain-containing protein n=1 Tax=Actinomadura violacea TaxID=2819934 RepID=A0ABS3S0B3_9ACTN|nr:ankyrin repeat domain-containing protein [Actinomadura violacea]MBO2462377.1 ankyrin repeat domain-containing protein [Actinomadura violacea]